MDIWRKLWLFISSTGVKLNADVNGALGIMLKEGRGKSLITQLSSGCVTQPRRIGAEIVNGPFVSNS